MKSYQWIVTASAIFSAFLIVLWESVASEIGMLSHNKHNVVLAAFSKEGSTSGELAKGKFLVAREQLTDPNFSKTVVLLIEYNAQGSLGLVINRPTDVPLTQIWPEMKSIEQHREPLFLGGPVARGQILLLVQFNDKPENGIHVFDNIYVSSSRSLLEKMAEQANSNPDYRFRVYAGYAGWAPGQLEQEILRGDWNVIRADVESIFRAYP